MGTPIPNRGKENSVGAGPVTSYKLTPEEIAARYPANPKQRKEGKPIIFPQQKTD